MNVALNAVLITDYTEAEEEAVRQRLEEALAEAGPCRHCGEADCEGIMSEDPCIIGDVIEDGQLLIRTRKEWALKRADVVALRAKGFEGGRQIEEAAPPPGVAHLIDALIAKIGGQRGDKVQRKTLKILRALDASIREIDARIGHFDYLSCDFAVEACRMTHMLASLGRKAARYAERYETGEQPECGECLGWEQGCDCFRCEWRDEEVGIAIEGGGR